MGTTPRKPPMPPRPPVMTRPPRPTSPPTPARSYIRASVVKNDKVDVTATSWQPMPGMSLSFNATTAGPFLINVAINGVQALPAGAPEPHIGSSFRLLVDGGQHDLTRLEFHQGGWELRGVSLTRLLSLNAGQHTVAVEWYTSSGVTVACWYGDSRQIQVIEL
jgi:hypothetical protein